MRDLTDAEWLARAARGEYAPSKRKLNRAYREGLHERGMVIAATSEALAGSHERIRQLEATLQRRALVRAAEAASARLRELEEKC